MQNWRLILAVLMVLFISVVSGGSVFADDSEDILDAVCQGKAEQVELWFEKNADRISGKGSKSLFTAKDKDGWTALICAAANNDHKSSELLIKAGAEVNVKDNLGWTPLMYAADVKLGVEMVSLLLDNGADPNIRNNDGDTPLIRAVSGNYNATSRIATIKLLVEKGADIHAIDAKGRSALIIAVVNGNAEIISFLLSKGAILESVDQEGKTPLMWAATKGNLEIVKLLLAKGADITKTSKEGKTALNYAMANGHIKITTILTEKQKALEANKKP